MYRMKIVNETILVLFILATMALTSFAREKEKITLLVGESTSYKVSQAISEMFKIPEVANSYDFYFYSNKDVENLNLDREIITQSRIIIVDIMYRNLAEYVLNNVDFEKTKAYGVRSGAVKSEKILSDPKVKQYYNPAIKENIKNLLLFLINRDCHLELNYGEPKTLPEAGIFHPENSRIFTDFENYLSWYKEKGLYKEDGFWVGIPDFSSYVFPGEAGDVVSSLIENLEKNNINVLPVYSYPSYLAPERFFFDEQGKSRVNLIAALSFKFAAIDDEKTRENLIKLGVPLLNGIRIFFRTIPEWRGSPQGLGPIELSHNVCTPEFNGLIEPSVLGGRVALKDKRAGKEVYAHKPVAENIEFFIKRIKAWRNLQTEPNKDKKIAIIHWNHTPGKQNVGASYLNVFRSLEGILKRMREEGYTIEGELPSEEEIKNLVLKSGRNIGSWVPGELDELIKTKRVIRLPVSEYLEWYKEIDKDYKEKLEAEWGKVEDSKIMIKDKEIIIPCVNLGNVILLPQPSRGWGDDPMKLYHSTQLWPHHQYTAFYLWLKREFKPDAIVSLGKHGTHEWLPGKQVGLSQSCPPEVLIQDIPNLYPYIVDNIGEGIQAKRRGRGVIIDHLIPAMKQAGAYEEYRELAVLIDEYNDALTRSAELAKEKFKRIKTLVKKLGLDKDLLLEEVNEEAVEEIEHYLIELQEANVPYGLHTFGVSPEGEALKEFSQLIKERNEGLSLSEIEKNLSLCHLEIDRLIAGLEGKYIPSGEGNDPLRNPEAIPTGKNFYGFDPAKVPSKDAYALGEKQAEEMVDKYLKENGEYPDKIGLVFWSTELQRNEGAQVGTALYLLGMKPVWDKNNKVIGVEPIPGKMLGRPRIDVHMQTSGLFRDCYSNVILLLDEAVRQASQLKDVENFIAKHSRKIKDYLVKKGYNEEEAENLSKIRVFSAKPGSYGTKIDDLIANSGLWESDEEIADVFINFVSFGYGKGVWGKPLKSVYKKNLEDIKITMHTRSSNLYMTMDNDDVFQFLGGLSLAVKKVSTEYPDVLISDQKNPDAAHIEDIERTIGEELRARYLNPKWIEGMKKENYAGAREVDKFVEYMWGWQVTTPFAIDKTKWEQVYEVYIEDKYDLELKEFFDEHNPWALQSVSMRMLEAIRKKYWDAPEEIKKRLAVDYAMSVIEKGFACCDHTCNNPALNQMVVNIISLPGLLSPELINQFQAVISKAMGMDLEEAVDKRKGLQEKLAQVTKEIQQEEKVVEGKKPEKEKIEGYEMVEEKKEDTKLVTSGAAWAVMIIVFGFIGLLVIGWLRKR
ncbi:TPA: cobaltochelatase subunit CobN [Candidatus Poribacteria bacterium]|nr:cobaltochelatase subunit CobN [Candidatus Poribacteria bacterium]